MCCRRILAAGGASVNTTVNTLRQLHFSDLLAQPGTITHVFLDTKQAKDPYLLKIIDKYSSWKEILFLNFKWIFQKLNGDPKEEDFDLLRKKKLKVRNRGKRSLDSNSEENNRKKSKSNNNAIDECITLDSDDEDNNDDCVILKDDTGVEELERQVRSCGQNIVLNLIENGQKNVLEEVEDEEVDKLTPDLLGLYTITVPCTPEAIVDPEVAEALNKDLPVTTARPDNPNHSLISSLEDDVSWFQPPISILPVTDPVTGQSVLEVKMKSEEVTLAAFHGLKHKYKGMSIDKTGKFDFVFI